MDLDVTPWLNLAIRWLHLIAGIAWIGASFYFVWLDNHIRPAKDAKDRDDGVTGELWSVHGGGFYHKQKYAVAPPKMPDELHWFKWEAYTTWLSGIALLVVIYYLGAEIFLIDTAKMALRPTEAIGISAAFLIGGWFAYDLLCRSPIGRDGRLFGLVWFGLLTAAAYGLTQIFSDRAAFIHVGAIIGTAMVGNVFFVIIPNQRKVVDDLAAGKTPDPSLGLAGKQRSLHNNYMTLPVLFMMISNHYPMTFSGDYNWLVLAGLSIVGVLIRHFFNLRHKGIIRPALPAAAAILFAAIMVAVSGKPARVSGPAEAAAPASIAAVRSVITTHCVSCHAAAPTHEAFDAPPGGVILTSDDLIQRYASQIEAQAVNSDIMPLGNETGMTQAERDILASWISGGAKLQ